MTSETRDFETPARSATLTIVGRRGVTFPKAVRATRRESEESLAGRAAEAASAAGSKEAHAAPDLSYRDDSDISRLDRRELVHLSQPVECHFDVDAFGSRTSIPIGISMT
jgi:hypothetical protein